MTYEEMFPCRAQIIRTREGRDAAPLDDYSYPENTGEFIGTLAFRCWHKNKPMLGLLRKNGFKVCGRVCVQSGANARVERLALERLL
jgi:hypothetical protein